ncbi:Lys-63-specific deubiquitinase BRCC36 [Durusdinium trenchii]|uniref:Lys-63-specific deubiquitinase BRCC36 n=1 Tax=Durusdinium trenchii TaxID=1381693 RepID=A0ABP0MRX5_9DINO
MIDTRPECRGLGFSPDDLSIVRLNREDLRHIKAIGISGKRSVMMACLVALYRDEGRHTMNHKSFWKALQDYELDRPWERLMDTVDDEQTAWDSYNSKNGYGYSNSSYSYSYGYGGGGGRRGGSKESDLFGTPWEGHGVTVNVICDRIPVVDLAQHSIFHGNASWLLQAATGSCSKADGLFEYCQDREVLAACKKDLRLTADEVSIARLKSRPEVKAVQTSSLQVMLALCLVLAHNDEAAAAMLEADIEESDSSLKDPLSDIMIAMHQRIRMSKDDERSTWRSKESKGSYDYSYDYDYSYAPKRKVSRQALVLSQAEETTPQEREEAQDFSTQRL